VTDLLWSTGVVGHERRHRPPQHGLDFEASSSEPNIGISRCNVLYFTVPADIFYL
jgi:hypothetical protein